MLVETLQAIYSRRATRSYTGQIVDMDTIMTLLRAATQAPSAENNQPWVFAVIQDQNLLKNYSDRAKALMLASPLMNSPDLKAKLPEFRAMLSNPDYNIFYNAGTLVVICSKPSGMRPERDCCLAAENLMLAAHSMNLATCPIGFSWQLLEQPDVKAELNIPVGYEPVFPVVIGFPSGVMPDVPRAEPEVVCWR